MKSLVVGGIVLLLAILGPQRFVHSRFDALWALGVLILLAYILQHGVRRLGLPGQAAWLAAGLLLGATGQQLLRPDEVGTPQLVWSLAGVWVGFLVGVQLGWAGLPRRRAVTRVGLTTLCTFAAVALGVALVGGVSWWVALLLGSLASLWGPFTLLPGPGRRPLVSVGLIGVGFSLLLLAGVLLLLQAQGVVPAAGYVVVRLLLSAAVGAASAEMLFRLGLFSVRASTLGAGLLAAFLALALLVQQVPLFGLPCGFGVGAVLVLHGTPAKRVRRLLRPVAPAVYMAYFALMGAMMDLHVFAAAAPQLIPLLVVQAGLFLLVRWAGLALYSPLPLPDGASRWRVGWVLLPRAALLFEVLLAPRAGLLHLLRGDTARLVQQAGTAEILLHLLVLSTVAQMVLRAYPATGEAVPRPAATSAA